MEQLPTSTTEQSNPSNETICKIWFAGDTAYKGVRKGMTPEEEKALPHCPAFEEIGKKFKFFDFAVGLLYPFLAVIPVDVTDETDGIAKDDTHWSIFTSLVHVPDTQRRKSVLISKSDDAPIAN